MSNGPYDFKTLAADIEALAEEGRPDRVLRRILVSPSCLTETDAFDWLKKSLAVAAAKGTDHLTDICFSAILEFSAGIMFRLHLAAERKIHEWDCDLNRGKSFVEPALRDEYLPAITKVHNHIIEVAKAQATCLHQRNLKDKDRVLKYAKSTIKVGNVA